MAPLAVQYDDRRRQFAQGKSTEADMLFYQLAQRDVQSMVILGDPTVRLPLS